MKKMKMALIAIAVGFTSVAAYAGAQKANVDSAPCSNSQTVHTPDFDKSNCDRVDLSVVCCYELNEPYEPYMGTRIL